MDDFDEDFCQCPLCSGWGEVNCHCGGDLCVCENYGAAPCPLCDGEGEVLVAICNRYLEWQRDNARVFAEVLAKTKAENEKSDKLGTKP